MVTVKKGDGLHDLKPNKYDVYERSQEQGVD